MYKELGDFFMTNRKKVRVRKKREGIVILCKHYHYPTPLDIREYDDIMRCLAEK